IKLTSSYPRCLTSLLMNLHTYHIPLNKHLHQIGKSMTPNCPYCLHSPKTIHHFLI
ncbi:hypothetical protein BDR06DRAFT_878129, partial [Suillus hirtellus]